jgi:Family of unknown function (DUF6220)
LHAHTIVHTEPAARATRWPRIAQRTYRWLAILFALCVVGQVLLVGLSLFVHPSWWMWHRIFGHLFGLLLLPVMLLAAFVGRMSTNARALTAFTLVLFLVQGGLADVGGFAGMFHPVNALIIFWMALKLTRCT